MGFPRWLGLDIMNRELFNDETSHPPSGGEAVANNARAVGVRGRDSCGHWMCSSLKVNSSSRSAYYLYMIWYVLNIYIYIYLLFYICIKKAFPFPRFASSNWETGNCESLPDSHVTWHCFGPGPLVGEFHVLKLLHLHWSVSPVSRVFVSTWLIDWF